MKIHRNRNQAFSLSALSNTDQPLQYDTRPLLMVLSLVCAVFLWCSMPHADRDQGTKTINIRPVSKNALQVSKPDTDPREAQPSPKKIHEEKIVTMSAYTSRVEETDSTPCISADGTNICKFDGCIVASNDYPFDTVLDVEGFGECIVKDRMSSRYTGTDTMDLYFGKDLEGALEFGRQSLKIRIAS